MPLRDHLRRFGWLDWLLTRTEAYNALIRDTLGFQVPWAWVASVLAGLWVVIAESWIPVGIAVSLVILVSMKAPSWRWGAGEERAPPPVSPSHALIAQTALSLHKSDDALGNRIDGVEGRLERVDQALTRIDAELFQTGGIFSGLLHPSDSQIGSLRERLNEIAERYTLFEEAVVSALRARTALSAAERLHAKIIESANEMLWPLNRSGSDEEWHEWQSRERQWRYLIERFISVAERYHPPVKEIRETPSDAFRPDRWTLDEANFPNQTRIHDFKAFKIRQTNYENASEDALSQITNVGNI